MPTSSAIIAKGSRLSGRLRRSVILSAICILSGLLLTTCGTTRHLTNHKGSDKWESQRQEAFRAYVRRDSSKAKQSLEAAIQECKQSNLPEACLAASIADLANLYSSEQRYAEAEKAYLHAIDIYGRSASGGRYGGEGLGFELIKCLVALADLYRAQKKAEAALPFYMRAFSIASTVCPEGERGRIAKDYAQLLQALNRDEEGERIEKTLVGKKQGPGADNDKRWMDSQDAAEDAYISGDLKETERLLTADLNLMRQEASPKAVDRAGRELAKQRMLSSLERLSRVYHKEKDYAREKAAIEQWQAESRDCLWDSHTDVIGNKLRLSNLYALSGNYKQSQQLAQEALAVSRNTGNQANLVKALLGLASIYSKQGNDDQLAAVLEIARQVVRSKAISDKTELARLADLALQMTEKKRLAGQWDKAESAIELASELTSYAYGADSLKVADIVQVKGLITGGRKGIGAAQPMFEEALATRQRILGKDRPELSDLLELTGQSYESNGQYQQAQAAYQRVIELRKKALGAGHPYVASGLTDLAQLELKQNRKAQAEELYKQATDITISSVTQHRNVALAVAIKWAESMGGHGMSKQAELSLRSVLGKAIDGPKDSQLALVCQRIGDLCKNQGKWADAANAYGLAIEINRQLGSANPALKASYAEALKLGGTISGGKGNAAQP